MLYDKGQCDLGYSLYKSLSLTLAQGFTKELTLFFLPDVSTILGGLQWNIQHCTLECLLKYRVYILICVVIYSIEGDYQVKSKHLEEKSLSSSVNLWARVEFKDLHNSMLYY